MYINTNYFMEKVFACVNGDDVFESNSLTECRKICKAIKSLAKKGESITLDGKTYDKVAGCFIGMYNIDYIDNLLIMGV